MSARVNIAGHRFTHLVAVSPIYTGNVSSSWRCICDCGAMPTVKLNNLRSGQTKSCGCLHSPSLVGKVFGRLLVLGQANSAGQKTSAWYCRCACGTVKAIRRDCLTKGTTRSCGCFQSEMNCERKSKARDINVLKICQRCQSTFPKANFGIRKNGKARSLCRNCALDADRRKIQLLEDSYVKSQIWKRSKLPASAVPSDLLNAKRAHLKIKRLLKDIRK